MRARKLDVSEDDLAEVAVASFERLRARAFRSLQQYLEQAETVARPQSFESWLYGAVEYAVREHLRRRYGRAPKSSVAAELAPKPNKRELASHAGRVDEEVLDRGLLHTLGVTTKLTAAAILGFVEAEFTPRDALAVRLYYLEERSFDELADLLGLPSAKDADRLVRRLNARLRYRFGHPDAAD